MGRPCSICTHLDRVAIEAFVASGSLRAAARQWGIAESSLRRHVAGHAVVQGERGDPGLVFGKVHEGLARMEALENRAAQILTQAQATGDLRTALGAIRGFAGVRRELRANLALLARLDDGADPDGVVDLLASPAWALLKAVIDDALAPYADAKAALAARLKELD